MRSAPARHPRLHRAGPGLVALGLALLSGACTAQEPVLPAIELKVESLTDRARGATWIALQWQSPAQRFDVLYGPSGPRGGEPRQYETTEGLYTLAHSVIGLSPDTQYTFRVRAYPMAGSDGDPVLSAPLAVRTLPYAPTEWHGVFFWPQHPVSLSPAEQTEAAIEAAGGRLYLLQAAGCSLTLSCLEPAGLVVQWTCAFSPQIDDVAPCYRRPDMCVSQGKLWFTWESMKPSGGEPQPGDYRQRLAYYELPGEADERPPDSPERFSAVMEISPSAPDRGTRWGSVASHLDAVWVCWTEVYLSEERPISGRLTVAPYEMRTGSLGRPVVWDDCPTTYPADAGISSFGGDLRVMFSDRARLQESPETEPLMWARFDGRRFYDVAYLRRLGRNFAPRGVQVADRFYYVYQSDASYPASGGLYYDIDLGRSAVGGLRVDPTGALFVAGVTCVGDMKHNSAPDVAVLGNDLFVAYAKREDQPDPDSGWAARTVRAYGTYITRVTGTAQAEEL